MNVLETVGLAFVIFTSTLGTIAVGYCAWCGARVLFRQRSRGEIEEGISITRDVMLRQEIERAS